jgi:hypothetical protein
MKGTAKLSLSLCNLGSIGLENKVIEKKRAWWQENQRTKAGKCHIMLQRVSILVQ